MGFTSKSSSSSEGWGMGFFLVFFPDEDHHQEPNNNNIVTKKKSNNFNLFSSSLSFPSSLKRTNSAHLLYKAQPTISICALLLFTTLLLFTISTLPSTTNAAASARGRRMYNNVPRRQLSFKAKEISSSSLNSSYALQGMGTLYRRGTRHMSGLIVAHAVESLTLHEFKLFIRLLYRSSITSRSDLLFLFPSKSATFDSTIQEENDSFLRLLNRYNMQHSRINRSSAFSSFDETQFVKKNNKQKENGEPIWGRRIRSNYSEEDRTESTRLSYGSVVGFDVDELDPENSLSGFLDHVPMSLRRWACYPMLLGRVRRNFKHVAVVDIKEILLLDDPFDKVRTATPESVFLRSSIPSNIYKHGRKNSDKTHDSTHQKPVNPAIISGGARGTRRLSNSMLTEIVRAAMVKRKKNSMTESILFNQLVGNQFISKNVNLIVSTESIPELSSLIGSISKSDSSLSNSKYALVRRGNSNLDVNSILARHICSFPLDSTVYSDC